MQRTTEPALRPLDQLAGNWITEATHPAVPGVIVRAYYEREKVIYVARTCNGFTPVTRAAV